MSEGLIGAGFVLFPVGIILLLWVYLGPRALMGAMMSVMLASQHGK